MIRPAVLTIASLASLSACAGDAYAAPPSAPVLAARLLANETEDPRGVVAPSAAKVEPHPARRGLTAAAATRARAISRSAVGETTRDYYVSAVQIYPWTEGAQYRLVTAPEQVSDIALQPGESLISVAAGDTARWVIGDTSSGSGAARRSHILVKPSSVGLRTNLVIATDRRVYHIQVESRAARPIASISWTYPEDALLALKGRPLPEDPVAAGVTVEALNFNYRIEGGNPPWRPLRAFDDGRQVFIEFPATLAQGEAPPLFVTGERGRAELVNYRLRGRYYVVDRLFAAAELRLGEKRQQIVRIVRSGVAAERRRRGS